ncbi:hypothetical protein ACFE04_018682 [Oxalis oulophora]
MGLAKSARAHQPCAACRMLRRRCDYNCTLAPYFPTEETEKFAIVHKVFGASNVVKMIQNVEEAKREDTATAIVYEAMARLRDPVYGSTGAIFHLQKMVQELKGQLETTKAQVLELQEQKHQLLVILTTNSNFLATSPVNHALSFDDNNINMASDPFTEALDWIL